jgi:tetratricopeptide (TPR) repeat protein
MLFPAVAFVFLALPVEPLFRPGDQEAALFRQAFERGEAAFGQGDYSVALFFFREAERLKSTPEVAYDLAKASEKIGDTGATLYFYRLYLRRATNASDRSQVTDRVMKLLNAAQSEKRGLLEVEAPLSKRIAIDGKFVPDSTVALLLPAGPHVVGIDTGRELVRKEVTVQAGTSTLVHVEPSIPPLLSTDAAVSSATLLAKPVRKPGPSGLRIASFATFGIGIAAVSAGTVFGVLARADAQRSQDLKLPYAQALEAAKSANGRGLAANVLWIAGGAALLGGALMFAFSMPEPGMSGEKP